MFFSGGICTADVLECTVRCGIIQTNQIDRKFGRTMELADWLLCDFWSQDEAVLLIVGINPARTSYSGVSTDQANNLFPGPIVCLDGRELPTPELYLPPVYDDATAEAFLRISEQHNKIRAERDALAQKVIRLKNLIKRSVLPPSAPPKEYVDWAASKGIEIPDALTKLPLARGADRKELPKDRRRRLRARVDEERHKGTKAFLEVVAKEEGLSVSRLKQLIDTKKESLAQPVWLQQLATPRRQTGSNSRKAKT